MGNSQTIKNKAFLLEFAPREFQRDSGISRKQKKEAIEKSNNNHFSSHKKLKLFANCVKYRI